MLKRHVGHWRERRSLTTETIDEESTALSDADADPERAFDARFLMTLTAQALAQLRKTYAARDRAALFDQLLPLLTSPPERGELAAIAARMEKPAIVSRSNSSACANASRVRCASSSPSCASIRLRPIAIGRHCAGGCL